MINLESVEKAKDLFHIISERTFCAQWYSGIEFIIYNDVFKKEYCEYCTEDEKEQIKSLLSKKGFWLVWPSWDKAGPKLITFDSFKQLKINHW